MINSPKTITPVTSGESKAMMRSPVVCAQRPKNEKTYDEVGIVT
jgi:hypothetical protein